MTTKYDLQDWIVDALKASNGTENYIEIAKIIWKTHESDLRTSGNLFYTWQYDMRWAANRLRRDGVLKAAEDSPRGVWELI